MGYAPDWMRGSMKKGAAPVVRKYADGTPGGVYEDSDDAKNLMAAAEREAKDAYRKDVEPVETRVETPKMNFKQAFAAAKDGSVFEWNGKKYKKEYASDKQTSAPTGNLADDPKRMAALGRKARAMAAAQKAKK